MNEINVHPSVLLTWALANRQAYLSGSQQIDRLHFLVAVLEILDDAFLDDARLMDWKPAMIQEITELGRLGQKQVGLSGEEITRARRGLRNLNLANLQGASVGQEVPKELLHRSNAMRAIFAAAIYAVAGRGEKEFTLLDLLKALMEHLPPEAMPFFEGHSGVKVDADPVKTISKTIGNFQGQVNEAGQPEPQKPAAASVLKEIGRDLTDMARQGQLHPVIGRKAEMTAIARFLMRTSKRNVILVGDAGVGKTAVVEGLAQNLAQENTPDFLRSLHFVQVSAADLVAGTRYRGDMEERVQKLIAEASADPNLVLFLDEIHLVMKSGASDSPMDIANILKPALARETFRCIGATTTEEFERYIKDDAAFLRRFQVLRLEEPSSEEAMAICSEWARHIEEIQEVSFQEEAIRAAVLLSVRFIHARSLPDKAIDLLENAASYVKVSSLSFHNVPMSKTRPVISARDIHKVLEEQYGISINAYGLIDPVELRVNLLEQVVGQDAAIDAVVDTLSTLQLRDLSTLSRPLNIFLFTGPTGVGKTYLAECLARAIFGEESNDLLRLNMNEFKEPYDLSRLTGAAPGFIGHERQGALFHFVEGHPQGLILLDEIEKAHPEIQDYFLQIFDKAESVDSRGRKADFRQYIFILTCNIDTHPRQVGALGFLPGEEKPGPSQSEVILAQLRQHFRPEFLGRIDRVIDFKPMDSQDYGLLLNRLLEALQRHLHQEKKIDLAVAEEARQQLLHKLGSDKDGVRGLVHRFQQVVEAPLLQYIQANSDKERIEITWQADQLTFV